MWSLIARGNLTCLKWIMLLVSMMTLHWISKSRGISSLILSDCSIFPLRRRHKSWKCWDKSTSSVSLVWTKEASNCRVFNVKTSTKKNWKTEMTMRSRTLGAMKCFTLQWNPSHLMTLPMRTLSNTKWILSNWTITSNSLTMLRTLWWTSKSADKIILLKNRNKIRRNWVWIREPKQKRKLSSRRLLLLMLLWRKKSSNSKEIDLTLIKTSRV